MAQSVPPGDIATQSGAKIAPINDPQKRTVPLAEKLDYKLAIRFVDNTLKRGVSELVKEYRCENSIPETGAMNAFQAQINSEYNRYKDVGCLDKGIVSIGIGPDTYIHANYVSGFYYRKKFICTQSPLETSTAAFWRMIAQEKTPVIIMLSNLKEQGLKKCADYFPPCIARGMEVADVRVFCLHEGKFLFRNSTDAVAIRRVLEVCIAGRASHKVTHIQWMKWQNREVPSADLALIEISHFVENVSSTLVRPIVVHCSAGIGRTGVFVLVNLALEKIKAGIRLDSSLLPALKELRKQRSRSIQSERQYLFVHQLLLNYVINFLMDDSEREKYKELFDKFTTAYKEAIRREQP